MICDLLQPTCTWRWSKSGSSRSDEMEISEWILFFESLRKLLCLCISNVFLIHVFLSLHSLATHRRSSSRASKPLATTTPPWSSKFHFSQLLIIVVQRNGMRILWFVKQFERKIFIHIFNIFFTRFVATIWCWRLWYKAKKCARRYVCECDVRDACCVLRAACCTMNVWCLVPGVWYLVPGVHTVCRARSQHNTL